MAGIQQQAGIRSSSDGICKALATRGGSANGDGRNVDGFEMKLLERDPDQRVSRVEPGKRSSNQGDLKTEDRN